MVGVYADLVDLLRRPAVAEVALGVLVCAVRIWVAVMIGLVIGWSWRPRWTGPVFLGLRSKLRFLCTVPPPGLGAHCLWLAFTALSAFSACHGLWLGLNGKGEVPGVLSAPRRLWLAISALSAVFVCRGLWAGFKGKGKEPEAVVEAGPVVTAAAEESCAGSSNGILMSEHDVVTEKDLEHLLHLLDDGDAVWQNQMERTTHNMIYRAWCHESETRPIIYRSRTVFEDATPELVRDFFWDDDFRRKWDSMLVYSKILEEFPQTGAVIVQWIKKFPFFCSDREYIIGRRIWESGKTYYCVTKGVPYPSLPTNGKPRRVELYFSSWRIRAVESRKGDGQPSACEVTLIHYEDMGIPKDVAKVGVRHGMWGAVKKLHSSMRAYQATRRIESALSRSALMAQITTKILIPVGVGGLVGPDLSSEEEDEEARASEHDDAHKVAHGGIDWRWVVIAGTVAVVCGLHTGLMGKALFFGAARRMERR